MERYRFHADGTLFYETFTIVDWLPLFVSEAACKIITDRLNFCHRNKGLRINAYVIMPTHLHAIVFHESLQAKPLEATLTDFRKFTGRRLADFARFCAGRWTATLLRWIGQIRAVANSAR
jgi:putative transposase